jgi:hypothetical protein
MLMIYLNWIDLKEVHTYIHNFYSSTTIIAHAICLSVCTIALARRRNHYNEMVKEIRVENSAHSYKPVSVGITKGTNAIVRQDNVRPGSSEVVSVTDYIYITYIQPGSLVQV